MPTLAALSTADRPPATTLTGSDAGKGSVLPALATLVVHGRPFAQDPGDEQRTRALLLDALGCALAAREHPAVSKATRAAQALFPGHAARGLGSGQGLGLAGAVLDSGAAMRALDFNDFYWGPGIGGHPGDLWALSLAVAEARDASLDSLLQATAIGYEVYLRLLDTMAPDGAFDHTGAMTLAGAALCCRLMRLDTEATTQALAMAAVRGPALAALRYGAISEAKALAPACAAISGLLAAQLAASGLGGPVDAACGPRGLQVIARAGASLAALAEPTDFGRKLRQVGVKPYPCIGTAQAAVAAALDIHRQAAALGRRIEGVEVQLADHALVRHQTSAPYHRPADRETADHSFPSLLAMALVDGELGERQFAAGRYRHREIHAMSDRLRFACDLPGGNEGLFPAHLHARLDDGGRLQALVERPPGHPSNPLSSADIAAKFRRCAQGRLSMNACADVLRFCLEGSGDVPARHLIDSICESPTEHGRTHPH